MALFFDFKTAFSSANKDILWKVLKERAIERGLIERIKEIYLNAGVRVKIGEKLVEEFWIGRGLLQDCNLI